MRQAANPQRLATAADAELPVHGIAVRYAAVPARPPVLTIALVAVRGRAIMSALKPVQLTAKQLVVLLVLTIAI